MYFRPLLGDPFYLDILEFISFILFCTLLYSFILFYTLLYSFVLFCTLLYSWDFMYPILLFIPLFLLFYALLSPLNVFRSSSYLPWSNNQSLIWMLNQWAIGYQLNINEITSVEFTSELQQSTFSWTLGSRNFPQYDAPLGPWRINN